MSNGKEIGPPASMEWGTPRQWLIQLLVILGVAGMWLILLLVLVVGQEPPASIGPGAVTWDDTMGPLLVEQCGICHGDAGGLALDTYENALKGGQRGPAIAPGDGEGSLLVRAMRGTAPGLARMPLNRPPLPDAVIDGVAAWIDAGAPR